MNDIAKNNEDFMLLKEVIGGNYKAYLVLADKHQNNLLAFMYFWTGERLFSQTIVLNAFEIFFKNRSKMNPYKPFFSEILRYAIQLSEASAENIKQISSIDLGTLTPLSLSPNSKKIASAIITLEKELKKAIILSKILKFSNEEIAEYMNLPIANAETMILEAEKKLLHNLG